MMRSIRRVPQVCSRRVADSCILKQDATENTYKQILQTRTQHAHTHNCTHTYTHTHAYTHPQCLEPFHTQSLKNKKQIRRHSRQPFTDRLIIIYFHLPTADMVFWAERSRVLAALVLCSCVAVADSFAHTPLLPVTQVLLSILSIRLINRH